MSLLWGFSFKNARIAEADETVIGMALSYPIAETSPDNPDDFPAPVAPFVELEAKSAGTWYINALAVFAGRQGAGIGSQLLSDAETQALSAGYRMMSIQVYAQNTGAFSLYERSGYKITARAKVRLHPCQPYYTGDVLLLFKSLQS